MTRNKNDIKCRAKDCDRSFESAPARNSHEGHAHPDEVFEPWQNREKLYELYAVQKKSTKKISELLGCSRQTIDNYLEKFGIESRGPGMNYKKYAGFSLDHLGYETWHNVNTTRGDDRNNYYVHQLLAISVFGVDAVQNKHVHHKNGIPWDNRPGNIELLTPAQHRNHHAKSIYESHDSFVGQNECLKMNELAKQGVPKTEISDRFGYDYTTIISHTTGSCHHQR